jgi:glutamate/tyrosine decarboxylase-like PLP-dependent enzyme
MDLAALETILQQGEVGTVVATLGTSAAGAVDPLPALLALRDRYGFRLHVDTAYGGYFTLVDNLRPETAAAFAALHEADSIAIDPHKHGRQPYACGCILFKDPTVGRFYHHDSPYTYFSSAELHLGEISLECSRAGASAVALWATQRLMPLVRGGEFARALAQAREAALTLAAKLKQDGRWLLAFDPELDIVIWAPRATSASQISQLSQAIFEAAAKAHLHLAVSGVPAEILQKRWPDIVWDQERVSCLRSCLMKAEHLTWIDQIWQILSAVADEILPSAVADERLPVESSHASALA